MKKIKDPISGFSHLAGAIASIVGLVFLIIYAPERGGTSGWAIVILVLQTQQSYGRSSRIVSTGKEVL